MKPEDSTEPADDEGEPEIKIVDRRHWADENEENIEKITAVEDRYPTFVEQLKHDVEEKDKKLREYIAAFKEKNLENDEFRARLQRENDTRLDRFKANLFARLLPILDNLQRAMQTAKSENDFEALKQGIEMVANQFNGELKDNEVLPIDTLNRKFNPKTDEAFMTVETDDPGKDGMIIEELEPGYMYKEKLIKAAKVKVAKLKQ